MVDAAEGVLGIEWIDGKSIRFLLGGGAEDEEVEEVGEADDVEEEFTEEEEDALLEYNVSTGTHFPSVDQRMSSFNARNRRGHGHDRDGDCKDASRGCDPWRPDNVQHDATSSNVFPVKESRTCEMVYVQYP